MGLHHYSLIGLLLTFSVGIGVGILVAWFVLPSSRQSKRLHEQLKATEEKLVRYQDDVREHFSKTSNLVNELTTTYHHLHEHLSMGAYMLGKHSLSNESMRLRDLHFPELTEQENAASPLHYTSISLDKKDVLSIEESYA